MSELKRKPTKLPGDNKIIGSTSTMLREPDNIGLDVNYARRFPIKAAQETRTQVAELTANLEAAEKANQTMKEELERVKADKLKLEQEKQELTARFEATEKANQTMKQELDGVKADKLKLEQDKQSDQTKELLTSELKRDDDEEISKLNAKITQLTSSKDKDIDEAKKTKENELKQRDIQIADLKAQLATANAVSTNKTTSPTPGEDMAKQIADLKAQLATANAVSTNKAQIDTILQSIKDKKTYNNDTYTIMELNGGFHIKLTEKVPATPAVPATK
jgi:DNA repair exonuclease SbcCD ATPase subunit